MQRAAQLRELDHQGALLDRRADPAMRLAAIGSSRTIDATRSGKPTARAIAAPLAQLWASTVTWSMP
jgi:hypothetical protein